MAQETNIIQEYYELYKRQCEIIGKLKKIYKSRNPNFPEIVSEYIVRKICCATKPKTGDLVFGEKRIEVKCLASRGPTSFGPTEEWDIIIFVDARLVPSLKIYVYSISNTDSRWRQVKVNSTETMEKQCREKRRPRITFTSLQKQLPEPAEIVSCTIHDIFNGTIPELKMKL